MKFQSQFLLHRRPDNKPMHADRRRMIDDAVWITGGG